MTRVLVLMALVYTAICLGLMVFQRSLLYFPQPRSVSDPDATLMLPSGDAQLVVTVRPRPGAKALIYFGGNAEDVSLNLGEFSGLFPDHALYLLHYRGYGGSSGKPTEAANHADAAALFEWVQSRHPDVAVIGRSLGSGVAVRLASEKPVSRLVLVTPYDSVTRLAASLFPWLPVRWILHDRYDSGARAPFVTARTVLVAAERDEQIPRASSDLLMSRFRPGVASLVVVAGAGHNDIGARAEYLRVLQAALR